MTLQWSVVVIDGVSTPGTWREQDFVKIGGVDMEESVFNPTTSPRPAPSRLVLKFPIATPDLLVKEMMEVWAGWRDDTTDVWSTVDPDGNTDLPFGGYITRIDRETVVGGEKIIECSLSDYSILLTKTDVPGWPTFFDRAPITFSGGRYNNVGWGGGGSVQEWLIGGGTPTGLITQFFNASGEEVRRDGVDPIFDTIIFYEDTLPGTIMAIPGTGMIQGYFGGEGMSVDKIVSAIADAATWTYIKNYFGGPELQVGYWMAALPGSDDTKIVPQFNFRNVADLVTAPDLVIAADADETMGEIQMLGPHSHSRDASDIRTIIHLFGVGGEPATEADTNPYLVYAEASFPEHMAIYPTRYQTDPGWGGGNLFDNRLHRILTARSLANYIESRVWGARGSIEFYIQHPVTAGMRVRVRDPNEDIDRVYIVTEAERQSDGLWRVRVGFTQQTVNDMLKGGLSDVLLTQEDLAWNIANATTSRVNPGNNTQIPIMTQPQHKEQNWITASNLEVPALSLQSSNVTPMLPDYENQPQHLFQAMPAPDYTVETSKYKQFPNPGTWFTQKDARPHPAILHAGTYTTNGTFPLTIPVYEINLVGLDIFGPGSVTILKNGAAVTPAYSVAGNSGNGHIFIEHNTNLVYKPWQTLPTIPPSQVEPDRLGITLTGTSTSNPTYVVLWEALE